MLEKTLESPLDSQGIKPVNPKGNQPWIFIGRTDAPSLEGLMLLRSISPSNEGAEAEALMLWPPDSKSQLIRKDPMLGKIEGRRRSGWQDEMVGWHHQLNGHEFEQTLGDGEGQGSLACCRSHKVLDTTEWLNNNKIKTYHIKESEKEKLIEPQITCCMKELSSQERQITVSLITQRNMHRGSGP